MNLFKRLRGNKADPIPSVSEMKADAITNLTKGLEQIEAQDWPEWKKEIWRNCVYQQMSDTLAWQPESADNDQ